MMERLAMKLIDDFNTTSDRGGVLIGNKDWQLLVPNGYGDGTTEVHIMKFKDFKEYLDYIKEVERDGETGKLRLWYFALAQGSFGIYGYDAIDDFSKPRVELSGDYQIYYGEKNVYFLTY